jgi:xanthine dehydrogenase accessory factor
MNASELMPRTAGPGEVLRAALSAVESGRVVGVATVIARKGSAPATPGQKLCVALPADGRPAFAVGTVGGGAVERAVIAALVEAIETPEAGPRVHTFHLGPNLGMCCGGSADILVEVLRPGLSVLLVGAGHVGLATGKLLGELGFSVLLVDSREQAAEPARLAELEHAGARFLTAEHDDPEVLTTLAADPRRSALVVMTHDHQVDQRVIEWGLAQSFVLVGGVGSRAKAERTRQRLAARGVAEADIARVHMPVGVRVGARRPIEIAVAIAGELISWRASLEGVSRGRNDAPLATLAGDEGEREEPSLLVASERV